MHVIQHSIQYSVNTVCKYQFSVQRSGMPQPTIQYTIQNASNTVFKYQITAHACYKIVFIGMFRPATRLFARTRIFFNHFNKDTIKSG